MPSFRVKSSPLYTDGYMHGVLVEPHTPQRIGTADIAASAPGLAALGNPPGATGACDTRYDPGPAETGLSRCRARGGVLLRVAGAWSVTSVLVDAGHRFRILDGNRLRPGYSCKSYLLEDRSTEAQRHRPNSGVGHSIQWSRHRRKTLCHGRPKPAATLMSAHHRACFVD